MFRWRTLEILLLIGIMVTPGRGADQEPVLQTAAIAPDNQPSLVDPLNLKVERAIAASNYRVLTAGQHTPWQIVHAILALKQDCLLNTPDGKKISAIEWLATSRFHEGAPLWEKTPYGGRGHPFTKPYASRGTPLSFWVICRCAISRWIINSRRQMGVRSPFAISLTMRRCNCVKGLK